MKERKMRNNRVMICKLMFSIALLSFGLSQGAKADEPPTKPILRLELESHVAPIQDFDVDPENKLIATASLDKTVRIWDLNTGKILQTLRLPIAPASEGELYCIRISPDGKSIACAGFTGFAWDKTLCVYIFDRESGKLTQRLTGISETVYSLTFTPNGKYIICGLTEGGIRAFQLEGGKLALEDKDYGERITGLSFTSTGKMAAVCWDGTIHLYNEDLSKVQKKVSTGKHPSGVSFSPDGSKIAVGYSDRPLVEALSSKDLSLLYTPSMKGVTNGDLCNVAWSPDGNILWAGHTVRKEGSSLRTIRRWQEGGKGAFTDSTAANNTIFSIKSLSNGGVAFCTGDPAWGVIDAAGKQTLYVYSQLPDYRGMSGQMLLSKDGSTVQFSYEIGDSVPARFSLDKSAINTDFHKKSGDAQAEGKRDGLLTPILKQDGWDLKDWEDSYTPKLNGKKFQLDDYELSRCYAYTPDKQSLLLGTDRKLRLFDKEGKQIALAPIPANSWAVNISQDGRVGAAALADGTIRWFNLKDLSPLLALYPHVDKEHWILWTPNGFYDSAPGSEGLLGWHVNRGKEQAADFFPVARFRDTFNRPDVITQIFKTLDEDKALIAADTARGKKSDMLAVEKSLPPVLRFVSPSNNSDVSEKTLTVKYSVRTSSDAPMKSLKILIDGRPMEATRKIEESADNSNEEVIKTVEIKVPEKDCTVTLLAENKFGTSVPASLDLHWKGKVADDALKPKLYVLAVGVSKYNNPDFNLNFAAKDATDFATSLEAQKGKLYREVVTKIIIDENATKENVLDGLEWIQKQTTSRDVAMIFLSGHGLRDGSGDYYYIPANFDLKRTRSTGILFYEVQKTVSDIAGKVLFFVDTCHSGGAAGKTKGIENDINKIVNELSSTENGAVVFSASTGKEFALEDPKWEHGAFTKALLEGLSGKADIQKTGRITVNMLDLYLSERVKELTDGAQHPTTSKPPSVPDFPILAKP